MRLSLLGTGNAAGMPVYGCDCVHCHQAGENISQWRRPASALLEIDNKKYLIDAGLTDITERFSAGSLSGIFLTHFHVDHVQGLFHLRWGRGVQIPVYCPPDSTGCADLFKHPGILDFQVQKKFSSFELDGLRITALPLIHSKVTHGYAFEYQGRCIAYLTDTKQLPPNTLAWFDAHPLDLLVIDTSYAPGMEKAGHNNLDDTLAIHNRLQVKHTVLTHIDHELDIWLAEHAHRLPESVSVGRDGRLVYPL